MGKGPRVSREIKQEIARIFLEGSSQGEQPSAKEVRHTLGERLNEVGRAYSLPSLRTVQTALTQVRKREPELPDVDYPWSLGTSEEHGILPEATGDLLAVWVWSRAVGQPFTIRQAKWTARLRGLATAWPWEARESLLYYWSGLYALEERASKALGLSLDTSELDGEMAMTGWERTTAFWAGKREAGGEKQERYLDYPTHIAEDRSRLHLVRVRAGATVEQQLELTDMPESDLSGGSDRVYAYWLRYLGRGPRWQGMSPQERHGIAQRLREQVKGHGEVLKQASQYQLRDWSWKPLDILKEAGY